MDLRTFIELATAYRNLGDAVMEQVAAVIDDDSEECLSEQNSNALRMGADWLDLVIRHGEEQLGEEADQVRGAIMAWINPEVDDDA